MLYEARRIIRSCVCVCVCVCGGEGTGGEAILAPPFNKIVGYSCCVCDSFKTRSLRFLGGKSKNVPCDIILQRLLCNFSIRTAAHLELLGCIYHCN